LAIHLSVEHLLQLRENKDLIDQNVSSVFLGWRHYGKSLSAQ